MSISCHNRGLNQSIPRYQTFVQTLELATNALQEHLLEIEVRLEDKLKKRTEEVEVDIPKFGVSPLIENISAANSVIDAHNEKTADFNGVAEEAREALERHHLSSIKPEVEGIDNEIGELEALLGVIASGDPDLKILGITELEARILDNKKKVSNTAKAAIDLTNRLQTFLGRNDLSFEPEGDGYKIMRGSEVAKGLSEGEKTAITFIYFTVQLGDQDFDLGSGIVAIDDPISSLDSSSLYQAFSFLKNSVKDASQIFLFTHNFDFLKLLINWCRNIPKSEGTKSYYMLLCKLDSAGERSTVLQPMDRELHQNENEYTYLFKQLYNFRSDGTIAGSYHIPNIARKVLETFLDFYHPAHASLHKKLAKIQFDENKKTAIQKFSNDLSHPTGKGFDPALVPETQTNVKYLLEMIEAVSPVHYKSIESSITAV